MEDKPYSVDSSDDINIEEEEEHIEDNPKDIIERTEIIIEHYTFLLYQNVCRSLFERHKLLFALLVCIRILLDKGIIRMEEFNFLLNGANITQEYENPEPKWVSVRMWLDMQQMASLDTMRPFVEDFANQTKFFKTYYDAWNPHK